MEKEKNQDITSGEREIIIAGSSGFCFGVKLAAEGIEKKLDHAAEGERIFTLGKLIHNDTYNNELARRGVGIITDADIKPLSESATALSPVTVFVRAHGVTLETERQLAGAAAENRHFSYVDCTCPYVTKIHKIAAENSDKEGLFILMGDAAHPEAVGIMSCAEGEKWVFRSADEFEEAALGGKLGDLHKKSVIIAAQTTFDLSEWKKSQEKSKKLCTNVIIFDTICGVTEKRQTEAAFLSKQCRLMIVIGGKDSSNTARLYDICKKNCPSTFRVADGRELRAMLPEIKLLSSRGKTGIVAGASTPAGIIQEVYRIMSENTEIKTENFEEMLESSLTTLNTGDTVTGTITSVTDAELQLDLGAKVTGVITADQATDDPSLKLTTLFNVGDKIEAFVIKVSDIDGFATLSKRRVDSDKNWQKIVEARDSEEILEGKVIGVNKGGIEVSVNSNRVFVPASQTGVPRGEDMSRLVGDIVRIRIIEIKEQGKRAIGSIRLVIRDERRALEAAFWDSLEVGMKFTGKVKSMTSYGAFVDLGGVDGMVHTTELSWRHIKSPADVVSIGEELDVFVKGFDREKKRISLGYKTEDTEPWRVFTSNYSVGDVASVRIVGMTTFGAFAELVPGVDGLIHISQIAMTNTAKPQDVLAIDDVVDVKITAIDEERRKVSLSIRALLEEAADYAYAENYEDEPTFE